MVKIKLVAEFIDDKTGFVAEDLAFAVEDVARLKEILGLGKKTYHGHIMLNTSYNEFLLIAEHYHLPIPGERCCDVRIRPWRPMDGLPYMIHTNRELPLMLTGKKPLAVFSSQYKKGFEEGSGVTHIYRRGFEPYVTSGAFVMREVIQEVGDDRVEEIVFYALYQEVWRIDAYLLMKKTAKASGWSEGFERMEGALLGYTDEENDLYIDIIYKAKLRSS